MYLFSFTLSDVAAALFGVKVSEMHTLKLEQAQDVQTSPFGGKKTKSKSGLLLLLFVCFVFHMCNGAVGRRRTVTQAAESVKMETTAGVRQQSGFI